MPTTANDQAPIYTIHAPHFSQAPLSSTLERLDELAAAHGAESLERLVDLIVAGEIVPISPIARVVVIDDALTAVRVETIQAGRPQRGWVPIGWLHEVEPAARSHPAAEHASAAA